MFVGAINDYCRLFLGNRVQQLAGKKIIVGCSGNFTFETIISDCQVPDVEIHSNDVSLYSLTAAYFLRGDDTQVLTCRDPDYAIVNEHLGSARERIASIMVLMDWLEWDKHRTKGGHGKRMWNAFNELFPSLVTETGRRLDRVQTKILTYTNGDVVEHFKAYATDPDAVFCCFAPTYAGRYEKSYGRLHDLFGYTLPKCEMLTTERVDDLFAWCRADDRKYVWYADRPTAGLQPIMLSAGTHRTRNVLLYSNCIDIPAYLSRIPTSPLLGHKFPRYPLGGEDLRLTEDTVIQIIPFKNDGVLQYKNAFLGRNVKFGKVGNTRTGAGKTFAVCAGKVIIGFLEFKSDNLGHPDWAYMNADFPVPGMPYPRISKLLVMLAKSGQTRRLLERCWQLRMRRLATTAFTDRPVSMKYRGVLEKMGQGVIDGQKCLTYEADFDTLTWQEAYRAWLTKHGSRSSSAS